MENDYNKDQEIYRDTTFLTEMMKCYVNGPYLSKNRVPKMEVTILWGWQRSSYIQDCKTKLIVKVET